MTEREIIIQVFGKKFPQTTYGKMLNIHPGYIILGVSCAALFIYIGYSIKQSKDTYRVSYSPKPTSQETPLEEAS